MKLIAKISKNQFGQRLDKALSEVFSNYSRSRIKKWIINQRVLINDKIKNKPREKVLGGENVTIDADIEEKLIIEPQNIPLDLIYEDDDIIIINKSHNVVVHPGIGNNNNTILNALIYYYPQIINVPRAGIIHRLDKNTTGLMVVAKNITARNRLINSMQLRKINREYEAVVVGNIKNNGMVNQPIGRHPVKYANMSVSVTGKPSITYYYILENFRVHTHLRLRLETGRRHQIRVHMSYIAHPLVGDYSYGGYPRLPKGASEEFITTLYKFDRQALHAATLSFCHPISGIKMEWHAPVPQDMVELINVMRADFVEHKQTI